MGWLYMQSFNGHAGPSDYLDAQLIYDRHGLRSRVLKSDLVAGRVYYAAVEHLPSDGAREVFAAVCRVDYNPRAADGYIFGCKDMTEHMRPVQSACPEDILALLTPTTNAYALQWRARCRFNAAAGRAQPIHREVDPVAAASAMTDGGVP
jgi:hypothetical protein